MSIIILYSKGKKSDQENSIFKENLINTIFDDRNKHYCRLIKKMLTYPITEIKKSKRLKDSAKYPLTSSDKMRKNASAIKNKAKYFSQSFKDNKIYQNIVRTSPTPSLSYPLF